MLSLTRAALVEVGKGSSTAGDKSKQVITTSGNNACEKLLFCSRFKKKFFLKDGLYYRNDTREKEK